jgi:exodeoxyribonuclease VII large subunit
VRGRLDESRAAVAETARRSERALPDVNRERQRADELTRAGLGAVESRVRHFQKGLHGFHLALRSLDPYAVLQRGYALVQRNGHVVESVADTTVGERLNVRVRDGDFHVRVDSGAPVPDRARRRKAAAVAKEQAALFSLEV